MLPIRIALALAPLWSGGIPPGDPHALAVHRGTLVLGTERGLYRVGASGYEPLFTRAPVRALAAESGRLLAVTDVGLYEWEGSSEQPLARAVGSGATVRGVALEPDGKAWVATEVGLFARDAGASDFRRVSEIPTTDVRAVRLSAGEVWLSMPGALWIGRADRPFRPLLSGLSDGWWEIVGAVHSGGATLVAVPRGVWKVEGERVDRLELGVRPRAVCDAGGLLWLAALEGVFVWDGDGLPAGGPAASIPAVEAFDLLAWNDRVWVAARGGILAFESRPSPPTAAPAPPRYQPPSPSSEGIVTLQRAVLSYLGIAPVRLHEIDRRARRSWIWPELSASFTVDRKRGRQRDRDETVTGGSLWRLHDAEQDRQMDLRLDFELSWDLARFASPSDALAISRERREIVELAERLLDRVNQTYFERERVIRRLEALQADDPERAALSLRLRELTAALDGWTGGAFTRLLRSSPPRPGRSP